MNIFSRDSARHVSRVKQRIRNGILLIIVGGLTLFAINSLNGPENTLSNVRRSTNHSSDSKNVVSASQPTLNISAAVEEAKTRAGEPLPDLSAMSLDELQTYATKMQTEFVKSSLAYQQAQTQAVQAQAAAKQAASDAVVAEQNAEQTREQFAETVRQNYTDATLSHPMLQLLGSDKEDASKVLDDLDAAQLVTETQSTTAEQMQAASSKAESLSQKASQLQTAAETAESDAEFLLKDIQNRASKVAEAASKAVTNTVDGKTLLADSEQQARNDAALKSWKQYLSSLRQAKVVPPAAADIADPAQKVPYGYVSVTGKKGTPIPGVVGVKDKNKIITVLPSETIAAVSRAFSDLGKPYSDNTNGPDTYDCAGLTSSVFSPITQLDATSAATQFQSVKSVPIPDIQVGDLVYFADSTDGVQNVGINLGGKLMLAADAGNQQVGVEQFPSWPYAAARVTLPTPEKPNEVPVSDPAALTRCGANPASLAGSTMIYPVKEGSYHITAKFGDPGEHWESGFHTGLDFAAPIGTPVMAAKTGVVTVSNSSWGGPNFVTIDHGEGLQTAYAHMSQVLVHTGDTVQAGDVIGAVGQEGNATGPHLHFEVIVDGIKVDPMQFLSQTSNASEAGWGGFSNGMIPESELCPLPDNPGHMLRCDAAQSFIKMSAAYQADMGSPLCITDSYRSYAQQVKLYAIKPNLAAVPGTSNHGWALAVDFCGGIESWGSPQRQWMIDNAANFGWVSPPWAQQGQGREEPWHWEFGQIS